MFNPSIPIKHSLNTYVLVNNGWQKEGSVYTKGENKVVFDGVKWILNGEKRIEFLEDIPNDNDNKEYFETIMNIP